MVVVVVSVAPFGVATVDHLVRIFDLAYLICFTFHFIWAWVRH